jgi:4-amino-4-deoxy-L-arabinose transferase-like glycosyltransferase
MRPDAIALSPASSAAFESPRRSWAAWAGVGAVLGAAAALRFWGISAGLPYRIGVDEPVIAEHALRIMKTGDFDPHFYDYPGLYIYLQLLVGCVRFMTGAMDGLWRSLDEFHPEHLFLWTRSLNALTGVATVLVLYRAGLRWSQGAALLGAALLAVWPNHVRESHFALTDVPLTFFTTLVLLVSLRAFETGRLAWFAAAGTCVGLAAATKYSGGAAIVMPLIAAASLHAPAASRIGRAVVAGAMAAAAFLLGAPYTILALPAFLNAFGHLSDAYTSQPLVEGGGVYVGHIVAAGGWPPLVAIAAGLLWAVVRAIREGAFAKWALLVAFPIAYFYLIATKQLIFARYLLPALPFLCLIAAIVLADAVRWLRGVAADGAPVRMSPWRLVRAGASIALVLAVAIPLTRAGVAWSREYGRRTTQDVAYRMLVQFIPEGSGVAVERSVLRLPDSRYRPLIVPRLTDRSPEQYVSSGITYVIASSDVFGPVFDNPGEHADAYEAYRSLLETGQCLPTVEPTAAASGPRIRICKLQAQHGQ